MDLNLDKLPWYGQVAIFVVLGLALIGGFYWFYAVPARAEMVTREEKLAALRVTSRKGSATANQLNQFRQQVAELEARLESLKAVLPEQKDVADLLAAHPNAGDAVEPGDPRLQAGAVGHQAAARGMADRAAARRHVSQPRRCSSIA